MTRFIDPIPDLTPCARAFRAHRKAFATARQFCRGERAATAGRVAMPVRCRSLELVWPAAADVVRWFERRGIQSNEKSLLSSIGNGKSYHGFAFEFVRRIVP